MIENNKNVIHTKWNLKCYVRPGGGSKVQETYNRGSDELQAAFDVQMQMLLKLDKEFWKRPSAAKLVQCAKNEFRDYYEIRLFADRVQQRPIGYFGPSEDDFTILVWATERGNQLKPKSWRDKADYARELIEKDGDYAAVFEFAD